MRFALLLAVLMLSPQLRAQNLVPNWSFEELTSCPHYLGEVEKASGWLIFRGEESCDLYHVCGVPDTTEVPANWLGYQWPASGSAYAGIYAYAGGDPWPYEGREYFGIELAQPLTVGVEYHATLKVSLTTEYEGFGTWRYRYACNNMGLLFSTEYFFEHDLDPVPSRAHVRSAQVIEDTVGWTVISGSFVADSAYRYVVVGNFFGDAETDAVVVEPDGFWNLAYYYVDEVCVSPDPSYCLRYSGVEEGRSSSFRAWHDSVTGSLHVEGLLREGVSTITVLDALGRMVGRLDASGKDDMSISTVDWSQGVYVAVGARADGRRIVERVFLGR
jgi:hypothetical protein